MTWTYAKNASALHRAFGDVLWGQGYRANAQCRQEVIVAHLSPSHDNGRDRFDWYIPSLDCVVEMNGEQHYKPVDFGGEGNQVAKRHYTQRVIKDIAKHNSALRVGLRVVVFKWDESVTWASFLEKLEKAQIELEGYVDDREVKAGIASTDVNHNSSTDHNSTDSNQQSGFARNKQSNWNLTGDSSFGAFGSTEPNWSSGFTHTSRPIPTHSGFDTSLNQASSFSKSTRKMGQAWHSEEEPAACTEYDSEDQDHA